MNKAYYLKGLTCANCAAKFEKNIQAISTVENAEVNFAASKIKINGKVTSEQINEAGAFDNIKVVDEQANDQKRSQWLNKENLKTGIALLILIIALSSIPVLGKEHPVVIGAFLLSIVIGGYDLFIKGFKNLFSFYFDMKTLMTIAVIGAAIIGEWMEASIVVLLFALSEALEAYSVEKARQSIQSLVNIAPKKATVIRDGEQIEMHVESININDILVVKPGERVAMDGDVITGSTSINQAAITGESMPVTKQSGDEVFAGTLNEEGSVQVRVTKLVEDTTLAKIIHLVEDAQAEKAPAQHFVDKFAKYYTPAIMILALLVAILPPLVMGASWADWTYLGLATLVVGCPCALIISTPVAIVTAIGNAARHGVLIKGGVHLEEAGRLQALAFDKTGTLTYGTPEVSKVISFGEYDQETVLAYAAAIESFSEHPLAKSIIKKYEELGKKIITAKDFTSITGKGAKASIDDVEFYIGNEALFDEVMTLERNILDEMYALQDEGNTVMIIGNTKEVIGIIAVNDQIRVGVKNVLNKIKQLGLRQVIMLTGDNVHTAEKIAAQIGISNVKAGLLPEEKLQQIEQLKENYKHIGMVGDGINDAPALATSSVGIAMGGAGTDTALETADIALMEDKLDKLPYTINLSRRALSIIKQNISFALVLKVIALLLVIPGWLTLWIAIIADVGATLIVVLNSMRLMSVKE